MRNAALLVVVVCTLAACGGGKREDVSRYRGGASVNFATGPISKACLSADRKAANRRLCGCIQGVANGSLSSGDQKMAASFFRDPHRAQEIRQSDNTRNEAFWKRYKAFVARSESSCSGY
ncbi:arginine transporter [uncultured Pelagimonas sp.]|uniref:arginine transporter n=1 Tax=uncultured Pelagimonas sp. TaxID=1618102 RepID=UPI0026263383|nr:arginine transporter [uncultured Pelagimonas sp.]